MFKSSAKGKNGIAIFLVLTVIMISAVLALIILRVTLSNYELAQHKIRRIKGYYAAMAGMNLAYEQLRVGNWSGNNTYTLGPSGCTVTDSEIPYNVTINITNVTNITRQVSISVNYTSNLSSP